MASYGSVIRGVELNKVQIVKITNRLLLNNQEEDLFGPFSHESAVVETFNHLSRTLRLAKLYDGGYVLGLEFLSAQDGLDSKDISNISKLGLSGILRYTNQLGINDLLPPRPQLSTYKLLTDSYLTSWSVN